MIEPPHRTSRAAALLLGALLVLSVAQFPAAAQSPPPAAGNPIDTQIQSIHQRLHITPAQEPAFRAFAYVLRSNEETLRALIERRPMGANANPVERLRFQQKFVAANAAGLQRLIAPFARLYAALSPAQKQLANQIFMARPPAPGHG
jgi:Spy/CpxP family protein refolding chaperone